MFIEHRIKNILQVKKHLKNIKQNGTITPERVIKEFIENKVKKIIILNP